MRSPGCEGSTEQSSWYLGKRVDGIMEMSGSVILKKESAFAFAKATLCKTPVLWIRQVWLRQFPWSSKKLVDKIFLVQVFN